MLRELGGDGVEATGEVHQDVAVPEAEDAETLGGEPLVAAEVAQGAVAGAVGLDDQAVVGAIEVGDIGTDGHLAADFQAHEAAVAEGIPRARSAGVISLRIRRARALDRSVCCIHAPSRRPFSPI